MKGKKNLLRFLAFFLSVAMIVTFVPALPHVYGAEDDQAVQEEQQVEPTESSTQAEEPATVETEPEKAEPEKATEPKAESKDETTDSKSETKGESKDAAEDEAKAESDEADAADTVYSKELAEVSVKVKTDKDAFAEKVKLVVEPLEEDSDAFKDAEKALAKSKQIYDGIRAYDIHFKSIKTGKEVEPKGTVSVEMKAKKAGLNEIAAEDFNADSVQVLHVVGKKAEVVADTKDKNKIDGTIEVTSTATTVESIGAAFEVESFSVFALTWAEGEATIHYGTTDEDGVFEDLQDTTILDTSASKVDLNLGMSKYEYVGAYYCAEETTTPGEDCLDELDSVLTKSENGWQYKSTLSNPNGTIAEGSHIYVIYKDKTGSGTPTPSGGDIPAPSTVKNVTDNGNGTYDIQLDIIGKEITKTETKGANVLLIFDRTSSMSSAMTGANNRFAAAKSAVHTLVNALDPATNPVQMAVFAFDRNAQTPYSSGGSYWTTSGSAITNFTDALTMAESGATPGAGGTNWESAFDQAVNVLSTADADPTYVIFLTDGNPTVCNSNYNIQNNVSSNNIRYTSALEAADNISKTIPIYGVLCANQSDGPLLQTLMNDLREEGHTTTHILANDSTTLTNTFKDIADYIIEQLGASEASTTDGIPSLSSISAKTSGEAKGFKYYKAYEVKGEAGSYTYLDDEGKEQPVADSDVKTYTYLDSAGNEKSYKYYNRVVWEGAPGASYSNSTGVTWNLGSEGTLQGGTIYSIKFTVWPSQAAYDLIADLNNGLVDPVPSETELAAQGIGKTASGEYYLKTNTFLETKYSFNDQTYTDPIPMHEAAMDLPTTTIKVVKYWNNEMDAREATDVTLEVTKDGEDYMEVQMGEPVATGAHTWKQSPEDELYISYGQIVDGEVVETGHEYTVVEPPNFSYRWDLTADVYRPMIVDGVKKVLIKTDSPTGTEGQDYYVIDGKNYKVTNDNEHVLSATNDRRSNLTINKVVTGTGAPEDAVFPIKITLDQVNNNHPEDEDYSDIYDTVWFAVQTDPTNRETVVKEGVTVEGATPEEGDTGFYWFDNGGTATVYLKAGQYICFTNVAKDAEYTITEQLGNKMPNGFKFDSATSRAVNMVDGKTSTPATIDSNVATGTIDESNSEYYVTYSNAYEEVDFEATKVWDDESDKAGIRPTTDQFKSDIKLYRKGGEYEEVPATEYGANNYTITGSGNNYTIKFVKLPKYINGETATYAIKETTVPDGYTTEDTGYIENGGTITNTCSLTSVSVNKVWKNAAGTIITPPSGASVVFTLYNGDTATSNTVTLDGKADTKPTGTDPAGYEVEPWKAKFINLPKYQPGGTTPIEYKVAETTQYPGFEVSPDTPVADGGTITNTQLPKDLVILKSVDGFIDHANDNGNAVYPSFAFHVIGYSDVEMTPESAVLDTVVGIDFANFSGTEGKKELTNLPANVVAVKVEEVASGNYTPNPKTATTTDLVDGQFIVEFANELTPPPPPDYQSGVVNYYVKDGDTYKHKLLR